MQSFSQCHSLKLCEPTATTVAFSQIKSLSDIKITQVIFSIILLSMCLKICIPLPPQKKPTPKQHVYFHTRTQQLNEPRHDICEDINWKG